MLTSRRISEIAHRIKSYAILDEHEVDNLVDSDISETIHLDTNISICNKILKFIGPGYIVAVGYMDPGNWATAIQGGAKFEYKLLFFTLLSNLFAMLFQYLCIKLGVVTRLDLAQHCRKSFHPYFNFILYLLAEIAIIATDLAEVIGSAIALKLLFGIPTIYGILLTGADVLILLYWWKSKNTKIYEIAILALVFFVGGCFVTQLIYLKPELLGILDGFIPRSEIITSPEMLYTAISILGATLMPHSLYLHSSLVKGRKIRYKQVSDENKSSFNRNGELKTPNDTTSSEHSSLLIDETDVDENIENSIKNVSSTIFYATIDCGLALIVALFVNCSILVVGGAAFYDKGYEMTDNLEDAYHKMVEVVGQAAGTAFALGLLASGQSSTLTGTMAGQIIMEGFLGFRLRPWIRRLITRLLALVPAICTVVIVGDKGLGSLMILSQVVLSCQLPFAVIPLLYFTSSTSSMTIKGSVSMFSKKSFKNGWFVLLTSSFGAIGILSLNLYLVIQAIRGE